MPTYPSIYIYIYIYMYILYTHTHARTYACMHACMHACMMYTHIHIHVHTYVHTYIHTYMHTCTHALFCVVMVTAFASRFRPMMRVSFCQGPTPYIPIDLIAQLPPPQVECLNSMPKHTMSDVLDQTGLESRQTYREIAREICLSGMLWRTAVWSCQDVSAIVEKASHVAAALGYSTTSNSVALNSPSSAQL